MLTRRQVSTLRGSQPPSNNSQQKEATRIKGEKGEATESAILTGTQESNENESSSGIVEQKEVKSIEIDDPNEIRSGGPDTNGCWKLYLGHGSLTRWKVDREWDRQWPSDSVECSDPRIGERVQRTRHLGVHCGRLTRCDENRDRIR